MSSKPAEQGAEVIPDVLIDPNTNRKYIRGKFLGKVEIYFLNHLLSMSTSFFELNQGGFAKCYELTDAASKTIYAGKIVSKTLLVKPHQKDKMAQEISIHRALNHRHVVGFHSFFEDNNFVFIVLELCKRRVKLAQTPSS